MRPVLVLLLLSLVSLVAAGDTVRAGGKKVKGRIVSEDPEVVVNIYNSTVPGMVLGVERFPKDKVKSIERTLPTPRHEFQLRLAKAESAGECVALAAWCAEKKLREERLVALEKALRLDPAHAEARKLLGSKAPKGDWNEHLALAREYLAAETETACNAVWLRAKRTAGFPFDELYLQRAWRSARQPKGYQKDRPVALRADKLMENACYTLLVPKEYDPLRPTPLVIGLHGGGAGGADGKLVVGAGHQAMNFYRGECETRGWICACPTAVVAGWGGPNNDLIDALLEELFALYNIDENRVYLVGHSMGGGGTWRQGCRIPETWAAIAPASGYGVGSITKLDKTKTGFYVYHSDDDPRCPCGPVRAAMSNLPGTKVDFVYTELPHRGHSFPMEVVKDIFDFFAPRRLARGPGRLKPQVRPRSSFDRRLSRDERKYLPDAKPPEAGEGAESLGHLLKALRTGGGVAEQAVPALVAHPDEKTSGSVARILLKASSGPDVRRYAAQVLGGRKAKGQIKSLGRALLVETDADALLAMLGALEEINDPAAGDDLLQFLKKREDYLETRTQGGRLHHSDWVTILPTLARAAALVGTYKPSRGAEVISSTLIEKVLLADLAVVYDRQNQRPRPTLEAFARAACGALAELGGTEGVAALRRLVKAGEGVGDVRIDTLRGPVVAMSDFPHDAVVAGAAREALAALDQG